LHSRVPRRSCTKKPVNFNLHFFRIFIKKNFNFIAKKSIIQRKKEQKKFKIIDKENEIMTITMRANILSHNKLIKKTEVFPFIMFVHNNL
jgi:hypothetical protein